MADTDREPTGEIEEAAQEVHTDVEDINIDINFRIIDQFSSQLYDNPRRAIEELVCNSYDAGAEECYISTPTDSSDRLFVLDNGESMDMEGIKWLWRVAESRKAGTHSREEHNRQQIGKFGVGKLAAFALGERLTYLATKNGKTRVISVDQNELKDQTASDAPRFPVYEMDSSEAEETFGHLFDEVQNPWEEGWETWTLALVEDIPPEHTGNELMPWLLKRMINSSIPVSSRFKVSLNGEEITKKERDDDPIVETNVEDQDTLENIQNKLRSYWQENSPEYDSKEDVPESKYVCRVIKFRNPTDTTETITGIDVPGLGPVSGHAEIYESKLNTKSQSDRGFDDHGFKIRVRGKLLNRHNPKWDIDEIGYKWWKQFIAELEIPGLDETLLVQRDSTKRDRREPEIARAVAHAVYNSARRERDKLESIDSGSSEADYDPKPIVQRVNSKSPGQTYEAISGLSRGDDRVDPDSVEVVQRTQGNSDYPFEFDSEDGEIAINEEHPLFKLFVEQEDIGPNVTDTFKEIYVGNLLLLGYLHFNLEESEVIDEAEEFLDYALRSAADNFRPQSDYLMSEIEAAAIDKNRSLVNAVADTFQHLRFGDVNRAKGGEERYVKIPLSNEDAPRIQIKTIGTKGKVRIEDNLDSLEPDNGYDRTFCVAQEYGEDATEREDILENTPDNVSLATIEGILKIIECHLERRFTYSQTLDLLSYPENPTEMPAHVEEVWSRTPEEQLIKKVLFKAHDIQEGGTTPSIGAYTVLDGFEEYERSDIQETVEALSTLTSRVNIDSNNDEFYLNSPPDDILEELSNITGIDGLQSSNHALSDFQGN
ncbi:ATP-binding protein [Halorubrum lipolyticum]|uniref:ATP-binding protein n=1 Tax=Halorubrum lipolyticum TaxID=368624 RepID=UPI0011CBF25A|nr:ATP-binding protein [Halorubrum lipolyticum]